MATRNLAQNEQGTTMVEFAFIVVVLFTIVFGIIEFGVLLFDQHMC
ncbi:MAG: pilus assembly protein [Deltaproteobacteria bacterium]|nr:pilus assembly protein [Deltaproteobacteria bacterium]